jgi:hypothetical protein
VAAEANRLERLRDPSHGRTLTVGEIHALLAGAGAGVIATQSRGHPLDLEDWMNRTQTPPGTRDAIRERIGRELGGGDPTGLRPDRDAGGAIGISHVWAAVSAAPRSWPPDQGAADRGAA